jgi:hypothetical protein
MYIRSARLNNPRKSADKSDKNIPFINASNNIATKSQATHAAELDDDMRNKSSII